MEMWSVPPPPTPSQPLGALQFSSFGRLPQVEVSSPVLALLPAAPAPETTDDNDNQTALVLAVEAPSPQAPATTDSQESQQDAVLVVAAPETVDITTVDYMSEADESDDDASMMDWSMTDAPVLELVEEIEMDQILAIDYVSNVFSLLIFISFFLFFFISTSSPSSLLLFRLYIFSSIAYHHVHHFHLLQPFPFIPSSTQLTLFCAATSTTQSASGGGGSTGISGSRSGSGTSTSSSAKANSGCGSPNPPSSRVLLAVHTGQEAATRVEALPELRGSGCCAARPAQEAQHPGFPRARHVSRGQHHSSRICFGNSNSRSFTLGLLSGHHRHPHGSGCYGSGCYGSECPGSECPGPDCPGPDRSCSRSCPPGAGSVRRLDLGSSPGQSSCTPCPGPISGPGLSSGRNSCCPYSCSCPHPCVGPYRRHSHGA
jgi:hypothetical protein